MQCSVSVCRVKFLSLRRIILFVGVFYRSQEADDKELKQLGLFECRPY